MLNDDLWWVWDKAVWKCENRSHKDCKKQPSAKEILRKLALSFNVTLQNSAGNSKNTQQLEDHVIKVIKNSQVSWLSVNELTWINFYSYNVYFFWLNYN